MTPSNTPKRRAFPGPGNLDVALRMAVDRNAYVELTAHGKQSPDAEVCGVLAGTVCEDDDGPFVHVQAVIRGTGATQGSTHVTFTQATWTAIHKELERDHPMLSIVGWYHTHPGFGVAFSEMDLFIQKNFFSGRHQIGLLMDPLGGAVAVCVNAEGEQTYLDRFWVDGREQTCQVPAAPKPEASRSEGAPTEDSDRLRVLEDRLGQLVLAVDEQRATAHRIMVFGIAVFCAGVVAAAGYSIYSQMKARMTPPTLTSYVPVPIRVGDNNVLLGIGVVEWRVPPELDAVIVERAKLEAEARASADAGTDAASR